jgi:endonuclease YncB( thermonuclease family)
MAGQAAIYEQSLLGDRRGSVRIAAMRLKLAAVIRVICVLGAVPWAEGAESWKTLTNCVLMAHAANDGDSFHVKHAGREYIFRLYFVDAPETSLLIAARVDEQAAYWGIDVDAALAIGAAARRFTAAFLADGFTVRTRFEDALGASSRPRYYALVTVGDRRLCEALVAHGLARVYGYLTDLPHGVNPWVYRAQLRQVEAAAQRARRGAWGVKKAKRRKVTQRKKGG